MKYHWDRRYVELARHVSDWSKDPSAKVGAVIADKNGRVVALGFNGFPVGVEDTADRLGNRDEKNDIVVHAEENAILIAGRSAEGGAIYVYGKPICSRCAGVIIQAGLRRAITPAPQENTESKWHKSGLISKKMLEEAKVGLRTYMDTDELRDV